MRVAPGPSKQKAGAKISDGVVAQHSPMGYASTVFAVALVAVAVAALVVLSVSGVALVVQTASDGAPNWDYPRRPALRLFH